MADNDPLILGQFNESESATELGGTNGGLIARSLSADIQGRFGTGASTPAACVVNGLTILNGIAQIGNSDTENFALSVDGATTIDGALGAANAGTMTIPAGTASRSLPVPKPTNDDVFVLVTPRQLFNGNIAARVTNGQIVVDLSHQTSTDLVISWLIVGGV